MTQAHYRPVADCDALSGDRAPTRVDVDIEAEPCPGEIHMGRRGETLLVSEHYLLSRVKLTLLDREVAI